MIEYIAHNAIHGFIFFESVVLLILVSNIIIRRRTRQHSLPGDLPLVSLLVPVRNESESIPRCIRSLLAQDYPRFEVLALDDQSEDGTRQILEQMAASNPKLRVLDGPAPPEGWLGKNWACDQLAAQAQGELLFFTDADTVHQPQTLSALVGALLGEKADLLSGFPRQEMVTWLERLLVPFFSWAVLCFLPLELAYRFKLPFLAATVGQVMLFRREAYQASGGHASVSSSIVDDLSLSRRVAALGLRWRVVTAVDLVSCRMYRSGEDAIAGFAKNLFAAFDYRLLPFLFVYLFLGYVFWHPLFLLVWKLLGGVPAPGTAELILCLGLALLVWLVPYLELGVPASLAYLYPLTILVVDLVALKSVYYGLRGRLSWKGRLIHLPGWKWV
jgi:chlorobactene glucosyltransferase